MNYRNFLSLRTLLLTSMLVITSMLLQGCGGAEDSSQTNEITVNFDAKPSVFFLFSSKKDTDSEGRDTYYSFVGETITFPPHIFSNSEHTNLDVSKSYWADSKDNTIQDNNDPLTVTDVHSPLVKACMIPELSSGEINTVTCVTFEIRNLPGLAKKIRQVSAYADNDHFQAGIQLSELESNDVRDTLGTEWQYRWLDKEGNVLNKAGAAIAGYKLDYVDIDESIKIIQVCVFDIVTQQCVMQSSLEDVPSNNIPVVTILDITGQYKLGGKVSPESRTSYNYTQPAAPFTYEWTVEGVILSEAEKIASELTLKDASYFETDVKVCMQRAYKNFTGTGTAVTTDVCKTKQFIESDVQVTVSYSYYNNLLALGAPFVFSGKFNGFDAIDYSTFKVSYQDKLLSQGVDYRLTTSYGLNDFTFEINSQVKSTAEPRSLLSLQCEFTYKDKQYSCIGGGHASDKVSIYTGGGLQNLQSKVEGAVAENHLISFRPCEAGDKLTWWLKDEDEDSYIQTSTEQIIKENAICYGNSADGDLYLEDGWAGKQLKLIVKRARNGLADDRIQILNIDLGEISQ